jgi:hypothetical protein
MDDTDENESKNASRSGLRRFKASRSAELEGTAREYSRPTMEAARSGGQRPTGSCALPFTKGTIGFLAPAQSACRPLPAAGGQWTRASPEALGLRPASLPRSIPFAISQIAQVSSGSNLKTSKLQNEPILKNVQQS